MVVVMAAAGLMCIQACLSMTARFVTILDSFGALNTIIGLVLANIAFLRIFGQHSSTGSSDNARKKNKKKED